MKYLIMFYMMLAGTFACAQQFHLQDEKGHLTGPFMLNEGSEIMVGGSKVTVTGLKLQKEQIIRDMSDIILPSVLFDKTSLSDIVEYLQNESVKHDQNKRGVKIRVCVTNEQAIPALAFSAKDITLIDAVRRISEYAGMKRRIIDGVVTLMPYSEYDRELVSKEYPVLPSVSERISSAAGDDDYKGYDYKKFFGELGVTWPEGSSIKHYPSIGMLSVKNTRVNLDLIEQILAPLCYQPRQIEIEIQYVSFDVKNIASIALKGVTMESLERLWEDGKAELIATPRVVTQSGQEATVKSVTEFIYPTCLGVYPVSETNSETNVTVLVNNYANQVVVAEGYETREVGSIVQVLPEVSPDGQMINLTMTPQYVTEPTWEDLWTAKFDSLGDVQYVPLKEPYFHTYSISTSLSINSGKKMLAGGGFLTLDKKRMVYMFVSARLISPDGKDIPMNTGDEPRYWPVSDF